MTVGVPQSVYAAGLVVSSVQVQKHCGSQKLMQDRRPSGNRECMFCSFTSGKVNELQAFSEPKGPVDIASILSCCHHTGLGMLGHSAASQVLFTHLASHLMSQ